MTAKPIIHVPDPRLKTVSAPIDKIDGESRDLVDEMLATMYAAKGIGLAAIQIGIPKRVMVMDLARAGEPPQPLHFINPEIVSASEETAINEEGCLSIPDIYEKVERPARVKAAYLDREGKAREIEAEGMLAVVLQHEIDHLDGILFIDYLSKLKRGMIVRRVQKADRQKAK